MIPYQRMKRKCMSFTSNLNPQAIPKYRKTKSFHLPCSCRCQHKKPPENVHPRAEWKIGEIQSNHLSKIPQVTAGEPKFVNPNSYQTCTEVSWKIGDEAGIEYYDSKNVNRLCLNKKVYHLDCVLNIIKSTLTEM